MISASYIARIAGMSQRQAPSSDFSLKTKSDLLRKVDVSEQEVLGQLSSSFKQQKYQPVSPTTLYIAHTKNYI
jgi:hypothetical protein